MVESLSIPVAEEEHSYEFLGFETGHEQFGLPLHAIREILKPPPLTPVPRTVPYILGIISVRGRVITVIDLRKRLQVAESPMTRQSRILLVLHHGETIGLLVDRVLQVYRLQEGEVEFATTLGGDFAEHVFGIGRPSVDGEGQQQGLSDANDLLVLLDLGSLLRW